MNEWMNEWTNEWTNERTNEWMNIVKQFSRCVITKGWNFCHFHVFLRSLMRSAASVSDVYIKIDQHFLNPFQTQNDN